MHIPTFRHLLLSAILFLPLALSAQKSKAAQDTVKESRIVSIRETGSNNSASKASVYVTVNDVEENEVIMGATVLLRRDKDKMLGKVSNAQGKCSFQAIPATYTLRVQMTGLKSLEKPGIVLSAGKSYQVEVAMHKQ